jgi:hypothetical protein
MQQVRQETWWTLLVKQQGQLVQLHLAVISTCEWLRANKTKNTDETTGRK